MLSTRAKGMLPAVALALLVLGVALAVVIASTTSRRRWVQGHGCSEISVRPAPDAVPHDPEFPYGSVVSCRELDREGHVFGRAEASVVVLLDTQNGWVLLRVDYADLIQGRNYRAEAVELRPEEGSVQLSSQEEDRLRNDIATRGGTRTGVWIVHYGDA